MTREALKLAIEALKQHHAPKTWPFAVKQDDRKAISACRAALAALDDRDAAWPSGIYIADEIDSLLPSSMGYSTRAAVEQWWRDLVSRKLSKIALAALEGVEPVQVWCDTCEGTGVVHQESQHGVPGSGGDFQCPDCDGRGFNERSYYTTPPAAPAQEPSQPEFFAKLDYDKDFNVLVSVYRRRADATPLLVHQEALKSQEPAAPAPRLHETDIYDFAGWLTTRPGVMHVGSSSEAGPMAEAVGEYLRTFPERFVAPAPVVQPSLIEAAQYEIKRLQDKEVEYIERIEALQRLTTANEAAGLDYENTAPVVDEREALDAKRYRWLRDDRNHFDGGLVVAQSEGEDVLWNKQLDAAIDAAMAQKDQQ